MRKRAWKCGLFLMQMLFFTLAVGLTAPAAETTADLGRTDCAISVTPKSTADGHPAVKGTSFTLYRVAEAVTDGAELAYALTENFAGSGAAAGDLSDRELAGKLEKYAEEQKLEGKVQKADADGAVRFENLSTGLYLLVQKGSLSGYYRISSFLVSVPMTGEDGMGWQYRVNASPKTGIRSRSGGSGGGGSTPRGGSTPGGGPGSDPEPVEAVEIPSGTLPQTGQLNWPVPVLAGSGVLLFAVGWWLNFGEKNGNV